jgi:hypothetical protein
MIELIRVGFPYLLVLYFVVKGIKEPLYFLAIPFLMFMSESIFFEGVRIFKIPGSLAYGLIFIWLVVLRIASIILTRDKETAVESYTQRINALDYCIFGLVLVTFIGLGMTIINYSILTDVIKEFIILISLFVAYFIIKNWTSNNKPELLVNFLYSLVIVNTIASFFYILHQGLHFNFYNLEEYSTEVFQGQQITRTFWFMPQFLPFSIAFILVFKEKKSFAFYLLLVVNIMAVIISYTRSSVINATMISLMYFILIGIKKGSIGLVLKKIFIFGALGVLGLLIMSKVLPTNTNYLLSRFTELKQSSVTSEPNNLEYRFLMTGIIISSIDDNKKILGMGSVTENQISWVPDMDLATSDMVWAGVIFRWGFVGLMLFILLYIFSLTKAFFFYLKSEGVLSDLALLFILFIISQIIESFVSWTFLSAHGFTTGLWYFAMLSALLGSNKIEGLSNKEILSNE